jgi:N-acetylneuraminic acid mutarotase
MASENVKQAIALIKSGQRDAARKILAEALRADPRDETAWAWLVESLDSDAMRIQAMQQWLKATPESSVARRALARLQGGEAAVPSPAPPPPAFEALPPEPVQRMTEPVTTPRPVSPWPPARIDPKEMAVNGSVVPGAKPGKAGKPGKPPKPPKAAKPAKAPKPEKHKGATPPAAAAPEVPPPPPSDFEALQDLRAGASRRDTARVPYQPPRRRWPRVVILILTLIAALGALAIIIRRQEGERLAVRATQQSLRATSSALATENAALSTEMAKPTATPIPPTPTRTPTPIPTPSVTSETLAGLTVLRAYHTATLLLDGRIFVVGGSRSEGGALLKSAEVCDVATGACAATASMRIERELHSATLLPDGRVLIVGGRNADGWLKDAEIYDPETDRWRTTNPPSPHGAKHAALSLADGRVLVTGACLEGAPELASNAASVFDPTKNTWLKAAPMESKRCGHIAAFLPDGRVLVAGGTDGQQELSTSEIYDPAANAWTQAGEMNVGRADAAAAGLPGGWVLVAGGVSGGQTLDSVEAFDPEGQTWLARASLASPRAALSLTRLQDGRALLTGGERSVAEWTEETYLQDAMVYDPESDTWGVPGKLVTARAAHTATLLTDGRVFVAGGLGTPDLAIGSTEVLTPASKVP